MKILGTIAVAGIWMGNGWALVTSSPSDYLFQTQTGTVYVIKTCYPNFPASDGLYTCMVPVSQSATGVSSFVPDSRGAS